MILAVKLNLAMTRVISIGNCRGALALVLAALCLACWAGQGDVEISSSFGGDEIVLRTSVRYAGAVSSLVYRGVEYVDTKDHGRQLQSAASFDGLGECYNPTEAGNRADRGRSSSRLIRAASGASWLETETEMAFWLPPGTDYRRACGERPDVQRAVNAAERGGHVLRKRISFVEGIPNLILYQASYLVPEARASAVFEAATGYMPKRFSRHWRFRMETGELHAAEVQGEQALPVILATEDAQHAMGVWSPELPQHGAGYGRMTYPDVEKWNCVFREKDIRAGATYRYRCFVAVGTVDEVKRALRLAAERFGAK